MADAAKLYYRFASIVRSLTRDVDYEVEEDKRVVVPLEAGIEKVEQALGIENLYDEVQQNLVHQLSVALKAKELYKRDKDYIIQNGEVKIVDEFTGRILEGRRWSEGIHQAVEAKEGVKIKEENQTLATITLQNYFRMYDKLAGMTGTAPDRGRRADEHLRAGRWCRSPPTRPWSASTRPTSSTRARPPSSVPWSTTSPRSTRSGQPVLVGTISVEKSEYLSRLLQEARHRPRGAQRQAAHA